MSTKRKRRTVIHALTKARSRYFVNSLYRFDILNMQTRIRNGEATFLTKTPTGASLFRVFYAGINFYPVFADGIIKTFYHPPYMRRGGRQWQKQNSDRM